MFRPEIAESASAITMSPGVVEALAIGSLPDVIWQHGDDLCDCEFQRICQWTNPYIGSTHEIRLCCAWAKLAELFPEAVRTIPAYWSDNTQEWETQPWEWNGETEMPKAIWYRHLARKHGRTVADIRAEYSEKDELRPKGAPVREIPFVLLMGAEEFWIDFGRVPSR